MNESLISIPDELTPKPVDESDFQIGTHYFSEFTGHDNELNGFDITRSLNSLVLKSGTRVQLDWNTSVVLGEFLGRGKQGVVFAIDGSQEFCVKIVRNSRSAKQFRREILGARVFENLGISFPDIVAHDRYGQWIIKRRWREVEKCATRLLVNHCHELPLDMIHQLKNCATTIFENGFCADLMPSNVLFRESGIALYETSLWSSFSQPGWTFENCFLPFWIPRGPKEADFQGFPPFTLSKSSHDAMLADWRRAEFDTNWPLAFAAPIELCKEWWNVVV